MENDALHINISLQLFIFLTVRVRVSCYNHLIELYGWTHCAYYNVSSVSNVFSEQFFSVANLNEKTQVVSGKNKIIFSFIKIF